MATPATSPEPTPPAAPVRRELAGNALGSFVARALLVAAGLGLVIGFLLPWFSIGGAASISGLGLLVMRGEVVEMMTGPHRMLLFAVPVLGAALLVAGFIGHRVALWIALSAGIVVIGGGVYTLIRLFFDATGIGMWIVVVSALLSLSVALLTLGRSTQR